MRLPNDIKMKTMRHLWICILAFTLLTANAQGEIAVNWSAYTQDTIIPVFTHSIDLGYNHEYEHSVSIEYPELVPLTTEEVTRFRLPKENGLPEWPEIDSYKGISAKRGQLDISFIPIIWRDGKYQRIKSFTLKINKRLKDSRFSRAASSAEYVQRPLENSPLSTGRWVKLRVSDNGIHMLTHIHLKNMGFSDPYKVRLFGYGGHPLSESDTNSWRNGLCEVPLWHTDNKRLLFYANGPVKWTLESDNTFSHARNPYSKYGYYFLTDDIEGEPATFPIEEALATVSPVVKTTPAYVLHEVDDYAWFHGGRQLVESYDFSEGNVKRYPLHFAGFSPSGAVVLDMCFTHNGSSSSSVSVAIDSTQLGTLVLSPVGRHSEASATTRSYTINWKSLGPVIGQNTVVLTHNRDVGVSGRLDYWRFNYTKDIASTDLVYATSAGVQTYDIGMGDENIVVWRVTDVASMTQIPYDKATKTFTANGKHGEAFMIVNTRNTYPIPEVEGEVSNQDLYAEGAIDYVIIVPASGKLTVQAERLAEVHRKRSGLRVKVVRADEVYNDFSSGTPDATAYRRYMKMLYDRAQTIDDAPKYLLLFGDGAWDNRMLTSAWRGKSPDDYLLCFEAESSFSATSSYVMEDYFGLLDDGEGARLLHDKVDIGIGRFPVTTAAEARDMVDKVIAYMDNADAGAWKNSILMLGDDGDNNQHMRDAEQIAQMLEENYPDYMVKRIYWDAFPMEVTATGHSYPTVRKRLLELFNEGALMVNYSGHGSPDVLSHELVISKADMEQLRSPRLPLWVTVSCDITPFDNSTMSFGEYAFLNPKGGAIALMTSTRTTYSEQNRRINYFFSNYLFGRDTNNRRHRLGDAIRLAKCNLITTEDVLLQDKSENKLNYFLMGDPALIIGNTDYGMTVDEINGVAIDEGHDIVLKAGQRVSVKGHVTTFEGKYASDFTGVMYASVFDNIEEVVCRNNADEDITPLIYHERTKKLFVGSDSVRNGEFNFTFRVPMDINYSSESGLINLYAMNDTRNREANGTFDGFMLGGTVEDLSTDNLGPKIHLYLNSPGFITGDPVNETPRLTVLLEDPDGINTVGNSIGHDLIAIIDGKASMTYNLNDYYISDLGDYTHGTISYMLPELDEGMHTLMFRAWDMMNNSSIATVDFEVVKGLRPRILEASTTHNPARQHTTFVLVHDRPETEVTISVEVFDFSGRTLWLHTEQASTPDNSYSTDWNLCASSGQPLSSGIYLYRVTVTSASGKSTSRTHKLTILRQ